MVEIACLPCLSYLFSLSGWSRLHICIVFVVCITSMLQRHFICASHLQSSISFNPGTLPGNCRTELFFFLLQLVNLGFVRVELVYPRHIRREPRRQLHLRTPCHSLQSRSGSNGGARKSLPTPCVSLRLSPSGRAPANTTHQTFSQRCIKPNAASRISSSSACRSKPVNFEPVTPLALPFPQRHRRDQFARRGRPVPPTFRPSVVVLAAAAAAASR